MVVTLRLKPSMIVFGIDIGYYLIDWLIEFSHNKPISEIQPVVTKLKAHSEKEKKPQ